MSSMHALEQRKAEILRLGRQAVAQRGARRRARWHGVLMVSLAAGATVLAYAIAPTSIAPSSTPIATGPDHAAPPANAIARITTTPGLATALAAAATAPVERVSPAATIARVRTQPMDMAQRLTDQQALALLKEAGTPAGIIKIGGRVTLVYHERPGADPGPSGLLPEHGRPTLALLVPYRPM
ncbi:MAG: hypothetical protein ACIAS6_14920 [Phycisphaerales bacterium JB060]